MPCTLYPESYREAIYILSVFVCVCLRQKIKILFVLASKLTAIFTVNRIPYTVYLFYANNQKKISASLAQGIVEKECPARERQA